MSLRTKNPEFFHFILVCLQAGRPGSHVLVPWLYVLVSLGSPRCRHPSHILFSLSSFAAYFPLTCFALLFFCARAPYTVSCVLFSFYPSASRFFFSEALKPHYEVWGKIYHLIYVLNSRIFDLSSRFWDDTDIIFHRRVICIYDYIIQSWLM